MTKNLSELMHDKQSRLQLCKKSLYLFALYYFWKYFTHISPEFHKDRCKIKQKLWEHWEPKYLINCEFRWSAKTSLEKIDFIRRICYKDREMMLYCSLDKKIAEKELLDISIELQTNPKIIRDFWQLFFDDSSREKKSKKTWVADFLTSNWIRVQAITTGQPIRWMIFWPTRPDYIVYDESGAAPGSGDQIYLTRFVALYRTVDSGPWFIYTGTGTTIVFSTDKYTFLNTLKQAYGIGRFRVFQKLEELSTHSFNLVP